MTSRSENPRIEFGLLERRFDISISAYRDNGLFAALRNRESSVARGASLRRIDPAARVKDETGVS